MMEIPQAAPGLKRQAHREEIDAAVARVLASGRYILGEETEAFESEFGDYIGLPYVVGVNSGTDAVTLALDAFGVGPGDEVLVPAMTAAATALAVKRVGAQPRFVDVEFATRGIDPDRIAAAITSRTKAIIVVHLHGIPAQIDRIAGIARSSGLVLVEDCAQGHGIRIGGMHVGGFGDVAAFSFYPVKNLGCLGDGGCVATKSETVAALVRRRRFYGFDERKVCREVGFNSRLDELQAAILRVLLQHLDDDNRARKAFAHFYDELLQPAAREGLLDLPPAPEGCVFHQYALTSQTRDRLKSSLARAGVTTDIHYPLALHRHPALGGGALVNDTVAPTADRLASTLLSMPIQPELMIYQAEIETAFASASRHMRLDPAP